MPYFTMPAVMCWLCVFKINLFGHQYPMSEKLHSLINLLADGRFHSGEELGKVLGVSRAAVWKMLPKLDAFGLKVNAVSGKGYCLSQAFELLAKDEILAQIDPEVLPLLSSLDIRYEIDSTNQNLLAAAQGGAPKGSVCLAEFQHQGRGRRGRHWVSPFGSNIYLSLLWRFQEGTAYLGGLSLAVAVALMRTLNEIGVDSAGIKWPNDILVDKRKLAGILLDVAGESNGPCYAVIGIGVNYHMPDEQAMAIEQPWTDLYQLGVRVGRNWVTARLLQHLLEVMQEFHLSGLDAVREEWSRWDLTRDQEVTLQYQGAQVMGIARGINEQGLLLVEQEEGMRSYAAGEVSLRKGTP